MSVERIAGGNTSWGSVAVRLFAEFVGFALLLFLTRFVARGHLIPQMDQECHIGGIAVDVLAHGIRFPLMVYAPNEYDNGSFFSGLLAAVSFALLGRSVLALKLVTHLICAAGAVATLEVLRGCLRELGFTNRRVRSVGVTALVIALALAPRVVTLFSLVAVGNHAEGSAIDMILLALFVRRLHARSAARTLIVWAIVGFALYLNKGTFLVVPVLGVAELVLAWRYRRRLVAAVGGFWLGLLPELLTIVQRNGMGWAIIMAKGERNSQAFPHAFVQTLLFLGEYRVELLAVWGIAIVVAVASFVRPGKRARSGILGIVVAVALFHLVLLSAMARSGLDAYVIYGYPLISILFAVLIAEVCARAGARWGASVETWISAGAIVATLILYRPDAVNWGSGKVSTLWQNHAGAACSWRFAEGFEREHDHGLTPPGQTREQYAIERCRTLSEEAQVLDCIGGIARELNWRRGGRVEGEPPPELRAAERRAYAYEYGTHRKGNEAACGDFRNSELSALCASAVQTECLVYGDIYTSLASGQGLMRPRCPLGEPPFDGFWAGMRSELLTRTAGTTPNLTYAWGDDNLAKCDPVFRACY